MTNIGYFSAAKDREVMNSGGFFCEACLVGRPADDESQDPRYCLSCYKFLGTEASLLPSTRRPGWLPKTPTGKEDKRAVPAADTNIGVASGSGEKSCDRGKTGASVGVFAVTADGVTERIRVLASRGKSSRTIERELAAAGVTISYRTIARKLQGVLPL